jgi:gamma-glutamylcysteine synthetase
LLTHLKGIGQQTGSIICGEPGCQIEWAPAPVDNLHDAAAATETFLSALIDVAESSGYAVVIPGLHPLCRGHDIPLSGRPRYRALQSRIETVPEGYGHDLSRGTCGLQVNVDTTPKTWLTIVQVSYLIQPVLTALFANAAAFDGKPTANCHSNRAVLWFEHWGNNLKQLRDLIADKNFSAQMFAAYALKQEVPILVRPQGDIPLEGIRLIDLIDPTKKAARYWRDNRARRRQYFRHILRRNKNQTIRRWRAKGCRCLLRAAACFKCIGSRPFVRCRKFTSGPQSCRLLE